MVSKERRCSEVLRYVFIALNLVFLSPRCDLAPKELVNGSDFRVK